MEGRRRRGRCDLNGEQKEKRTVRSEWRAEGEEEGAIRVEGRRRRGRCNLSGGQKEKRKVQSEWRAEGGEDGAI